LFGVIEDPERKEKFPSFKPSQINVPDIKDVDIYKSEHCMVIQRSKYL